MVKLVRLRIVRERKAITQVELADRSGVSRGAIIAIESGQASPRPPTVRKIAQALGVEPAELMAPESG